MSKTVVYALPINPEPWAVGSAFVKRGGGKTFAAIAPDKTLRTYQEAVRAELESLGVKEVPGKYMLELYFYRQNAQYTDAAGRRRTRNRPDVTNMQKATEDALQGVLIGNDRDVVSVSSHLVEAGPEVDPKVVVCLTYGLDLESVPVPGFVMSAIDDLNRAKDQKVQDMTEANVWTP